MRVTKTINGFHLKYEFHKKYFRINEPLASRTLFSPSFFQISTETALIWKKRGEKVLHWSEVHFFGSTSYEIHILVYLWMFFHINPFS